MEFTKAELQSVVTDPARVQHTVLSQLELDTNGDKVVINATNPFTMLLEATAAINASGIAETIAITRKLYPVMAEQAEDIYGHLSDSELAGMFAVPSEAILVFHINVLSLKAKGYRPSTNVNYTESTIPIGTEVVILNTTFTLLNDIVVRIYDNDNVTVEQLQNNNETSIKDLGMLPAGIVSDADSNAWLVFETRVKQVKRYQTYDTVTKSKGFSKPLVLNDKYYHSDVSIKNNAYPTYTKLSTTHSDAYINPSIPTAYVRIGDGEVLFQIPDVYLIDGENIDGSVMLELYETKGNIYLPINKYPTTDFVISLGDTSRNLSTASSSGLTILVNSRTVLEGGVDGKSLEELKTSIIYNTTGSNLPITTAQLANTAQGLGYNIMKASDVITERQFVASKGLPTYDSNLVLAEMDIFFNTAEIILSKDLISSNLYQKDDYFIIKSGTVFKASNGVVKIVSDYELSNLDNMTIANKLEYVKSNRMYYTPYFYIVNIEDGFTSSKVYDLDRPSLDKLQIVGKNTNIIYRANTDKYTVVKTTTGYRVTLSITSNEEFKTLNPNSIYMQMGIPLLGGNVKAYIDGVYDPTTGYYSFDIESDLLISDGYLDLKNGGSTILKKRFDLDTEVTLNIYAANVVDSTKYGLEEIYFETASSIAYAVLTKEKIQLTLGRSVDYIWSRLYSAYTERKYKTYTHDIPMSYEEDVYERDPVTGSIYTCDDTTKQLTKNLLHSKGDPVLDKNNDRVMIQKQGDVIIGFDGSPEIDVMAGLVRYLDIFMYEYEFQLAQSTPYIKYKELVQDIVDKYLYTDMELLNSKVLENTEMLYRESRRDEALNVNIANKLKSVDSRLKPKVILMVSSTSSLSTVEIEQYKNKVGRVIRDSLNQTIIKVSDIKEAIKTSLGSSIVAVGITNLVNGYELEVLKIDSSSNNLFTLGKMLDVNKNNELVVRYDLELEVEYI